MRRRGISGRPIPCIALALLLAGGLTGSALRAQPASPPLPGSPPVHSGANLRVMEVLPLQLEAQLALQGPFDAQPIDHRLTELAAIAVPVEREPFARDLPPFGGRKECQQDSPYYAAWYRLQASEAEPIRLVEVENEWGRFRLTLAQPRYVVAPTRVTRIEPSATVPQGERAVETAPAGEPGAGKEANELPAPADTLPPPASFDSGAGLPQPARDRSPDGVRLTAGQTEAGQTPSLGADPAQPAAPQPAAGTVPAAGESQASPSDQPVVSGLDHYKVYQVIAQHCIRPIGRKYNLCGPHGLETAVSPGRPRYLAVPVDKLHDGNRSERLHPEDYYVVYSMEPQFELYARTHLENQFGSQIATVCSADLLAVRSRGRLIPGPTGVDPILVRDVVDLDIQQEVHLEGAFDHSPIKSELKKLTVLATTADVAGFEIGDPAAGYTGYMLHTYFADPVRTVKIWNRFGEQELTLGRPVHLLVPARREGEAAGGVSHDHYKCFVVLKSCCAEAQVVTVTAENGVRRSVEVGYPKFFCVPVAKTRGGVTEPVHHPGTYLTLYDVKCDAATGQWGVTDQFGTNQLTVRDSVLLGIPSLRFETFPPVGGKQLPAPAAPPQIEASAQR